ncbi:protein shisa-5-like isoform X2 [Anneissia japonica]|uniref:protein shisa-5-like isoform X2 n=1 Tax=Anneissia japonica TaxID=1529436 RepID=UPI001425A3BA|nr:protein shisa-5-like isoform X2 [Anneissia japonica]
MGDDLDTDIFDNTDELNVDSGGVSYKNIRVTIGGICALFIFVFVCVVMCCCFCSCCCVNKKRRARSMRQAPRTRVAYSPANQSTPTTIINHTPPPQINNYHTNHVYPQGHSVPYGHHPAQSQPLYPVLQTSNHQNASAPDAPPPYPFTAGGYGGAPSYQPPSNPHYHPEKAPFM